MIYDCRKHNNIKCIIFKLKQQNIRTKLMPPSLGVWPCIGPRATNSLNP